MENEKVRNGDMNGYRVDMNITSMKNDGGVHATAKLRDRIYKRKESLDWLVADIRWQEYKTTKVKTNSPSTSSKKYMVI